MRKLLRIRHTGFDKAPVNSWTCIHLQLQLQILAQSYSVISGFDNRQSSDKYLSRTLSLVKVPPLVEISTTLYPESPTFAKFLVYLTSLPPVFKKSAAASDTSIKPTIVKGNLGLKFLTVLEPSAASINQRSSVDAARLHAYWVKCSER